MFFFKNIYQCISTATCFVGLFFVSFFFADSERKLHVYCCHWLFMAVFNLNTCMFYIILSFARSLLFWLIFYDEMMLLQ